MTLSDKRVMGIACKTSWVYPETELKEKIKELKDKTYHNLQLNKIINKIFGDKLTKRSDKN